MPSQSPRLQALAFAAAIAVSTFSGWAAADPPSRVARLGYMTGAVSFSLAGESDWVQASINRPLTTGDRIWVDAGARAEIQVGGTIIRVNGGTGVSVLNLDDRIAQLQLTQGSLNVRVRRLDRGQAFEVDTPNLAFTLRQPGEFRISVDPDGNATDVIVRKGQGEVYGEGAAYVIDSRQPYRFSGTGLREYQYVEAPRADEFDRWASDRDRGYDTSVSARYVSPDVVGYQDLDANGTWRVDANYGNVWVPNRVAAGWAPYSAGHWAWVDPWGWTWVDDAPWGFAVSHYGRWTNLNGTWGWVPGPVRTQAYYAPALVAFVGGDNFQLTIGSGSVGGIAWFPLGPREIYRPSYQVSRTYFENVNRSNTIVNNTTINNTYSNTNVTNVTYVNRQVPGAVVAVPTTTFVQSQPVARAAVPIPRETLSRGQVAFVAPVAPTEKSVRGAASQGDKPPPSVFERPVVARTAPTAAHAGFAAQQQQLTAKPGQPLDDSTRKELKPAATAPTPVVKVVESAQKAAPTLPPPTVAGTKPGGDARAKGDQRAQPAPAPAPPQAAAAAPVAPAKAAAPAPTAPPTTAAPTPAALLPAPSAKADQRDKPDKANQRAEPAMTSPVAAKRTAEPAAVPRDAERPAPATQPPPSPPAAQLQQPSPPPQRAVQMKAPPTPIAPPVAVVKELEPRAPAAVAPLPPPQPLPVARVAPRGQEQKPAAGKPKDDSKGKDGDETKADDENGKKKG
jgi:hypothetical protein